ncbi:hypothetical protein CHS0354_021998 [Potamilus streckersoni]|uniref:Uncharacterized protein n=1 Tax=Potamilus streckersoni TaxID=2493646 RepID=A0AAE0VX70_9BIVA|nr:hypothetical protein CHS0354_021998 [Potamilus streckersoni]
MERLLINEDESDLGDEDSSDEIFVPAGRSYKKYARRKEQELRLNMEEMSGTFKMIPKGFNRLQSLTL